MDKMLENPLPIPTDPPHASPMDSSTADQATSLSPPALPQHRQQRKGGGTRAWMVVESGGWSGVEEFGKHAIMRRAGIPARDLRILDPMLSYPSTILGRERAIVVKLEFIKAIVTAQEVLVLNSSDPLVASFVRELKSRVSNTSPKNAQSDGQMDMELANTLSNHFSSFDGGVNVIKPSHDFGSSASHAVKEESAWPIPSSEIPKVGAPKTLPFEFRALEVCLECACRCLEIETSTLELEAHPALDELTSKISTLNLERVRQIKSRLVAISGRVQKVRDELEHLLDDDMDMAEMYLTDKLNRQQLEEMASIDEIEDDAIELDDYYDINSMNKTRGSSANLSLSPNIEELEMLLEAYFVQTEGILHKLSALREYVDDTEDYINIMLDDKQNQLLQMGVILSTATMVTSAGIAAVSVFGMNIHVSIFDEDAAPSKFWETTIGCIVSCIVLFITALTWGKKKGLLS